MRCARTRGPSTTSRELSRRCRRTYRAALSLVTPDTPVRQSQSVGPSIALLFVGAKSFPVPSLE